MPPKLLLADDSVTIQRVIELTFAGEDVQVLTAGDGEQAVQRIQTDRPDIVLADIGMPKRSGYEVAAFVKGHPDLSHIPVLLLTGAFEPVDESRAQAVGCDGVLVKPFEPQNVIARVRELLQGAGRQSTVRAVSDVPRPVERLASHRALELPPRYDSPPAPRPTDTAITPGIAPPVGARAASDAALDDYFDRLDAAFANIATQGPDAVSRGSDQKVHEPQVMPRSTGPVMENELDWFDSPSHAARALPEAVPQPPQTAARDLSAEPPATAASGPAPSDLPATFASPPSTIQWPVSGVVEGLTGGIRHPEPPPPEPPDQSPTITPEPMTPAAARAADLARPPVHSASTLADTFSALLAVEQGEPGAAPVRFMTLRTGPDLTDEVIDAIARRVVERLAPDTVRAVVSQVVSEVAERLVRDEISRIRKR